MSNWIRFHDEIRRGKHRGVPRALRFVFLELCLEARPSRGVVELPLGMTLVEGVHDLLGGSRREVAAALELYTRGPGEVPSVRIEGQEGALRLVIPSWSKWNPIDLSADRMRRLRESRALSKASDASQGVTVTPPDQSRGDQIRSDPPVVPPSGDQAEQVPVLAADPRPKRAKGERKQRAADMSHRPESWSPSDGHHELGATLGLSRAAVLALVPEWTDYHRAHRTLIADFDASFRTWIRNSVRFAGRRGAGVQQPAKPGEFQWKRTNGA